MGCPFGAEEALVVSELYQAEMLRTMECPFGAEEPVGRSKTLRAAEEALGRSKASRSMIIPTFRRLCRQFRRGA
jgi:hypothetical protein